MRYNTWKVICRLVMIEATISMPISCRTSNKFGAPALEQRYPKIPIASTVFIAKDGQNTAPLASKSIKNSEGSSVQSGLQGRQRAARAGETYQSDMGQCL